MKVSVNGKERDFAIEEGRPFGDFLQQLRSACTSPSSCISSIRVDGIEVPAADGGDLAVISVSEIHEIEISTAHPRELAEETLQNLKAYSEQLEALSRLVGAELTQGRSPVIEFGKLMDGLHVFTEGVEGVKQVLGLPQGISPVLEADLLSILKDLLSYYQLGQMDYVAELLVEHVPCNLEEWRTKTIPALIRSRDS